MMRGQAGLELSFLIEDEVLVEVGVESPIKFGSVCGGALSKQERDAVWCALPEWLQEKLMERAMGDAEEVDGDHAAE